jgi:anti-sigma factor RsiW
MNCADVKLRLLDDQRNRLPAKAEEEVRAHLETCPSCAQAADAERALSEVLETRLPQYPATPALKRRLAGLMSVSAPARAPSLPFPLARWVAPALAAGLLVATGVLLHGRTTGRGDELALFTTEAVNDYLRVLNSQRRVEVESGGPHQVKPWFEGKLDFAPDVPELPALTLQGGSVGYFKDRKAAVIVYTLRLHTVTLLEVRAADLPWPSDAHQVRATSDRHFNVFSWRTGDLGYVLVSDADANELGAIAREIAARR